MQGTTDILPEKIFQLQRSENPDMLTAVHTRERVCDDPEISDGAFRLFARLLDMSLNPYLNLGRKGEIVISQTKLGEFLNCEERSIRRRVDELIRSNYIWVSFLPRPNTHPIRRYHVTAFQPKKQARMEMTGDGLWGNGARRLDRGFQGCERTPTGQMRRVPLAEAVSEKPQNPPFCQQSPVPEVKSDLSHRSKLSSPTGQNCPVPEVKIVLSHRSKLSSPTGQNCPLPQVKSDLSPRTAASDLGESQQEPEGVLEPSFKRSTGNASKTGFKKASPENFFLADVWDVFEKHSSGSSEFEEKNSGGFWRMNFRAAPKLMRRVLAETLCAVKEHRIVESPGQYAVDLWQRWGGPAARAKWDLAQGAS